MTVALLQRVLLFRGFYRMVQPHSHQLRLGVGLFVEACSCIVVQGGCPQQRRSCCLAGIRDMWDQRCRSLVYDVVMPSYSSDTIRRERSSCKHRVAGFPVCLFSAVKCRSARTAMPLCHHLCPFSRAYTTER